MGVDQDRMLQALDPLEQALDANAERTKLIKQRIAYVREKRAANVPYTEMLGGTDSAVVRLVTDSAIALDHYGVRLRRIAAQELYDSGMTMEQIAAVFGVTRQRVSALLKPSAR